MVAEPNRREDEESEVADAELLFREPRSPSGDANRPAAPSAPADGYALQEPDDVEPPPRPIVVPAPEPERPRKVARSERPTLEPSEAVEQVWSRGAEWGPSLTLLVAAGAFLVLLLYFAFSFEWSSLALFLLFAGGIGLFLLSYPILITLERPVRVTPEQALKDYYGALSHHMPHYRRMWLLLSRAGRTSGPFGSFEGFQNYWRERLARLRGDRIAKTVPLKFQVTGFKGAQSSGLTNINVSYTVEVYARGRTHEGPLATYRIDVSLVKGPDRMWYLDRGTLPDA